MSELSISEEPISELLVALRDGHSDAADRLWSVYFQLMCELAGRRLGNSPNLLADHEDVALSAFKSFCVGIRKGRFPTLKDREGLWPLLIALTMRKSVDAIRHGNRQKRGGGNAENSPRLAKLDRTVDVLNSMANGPQPEVTMELHDLLQRLLESLRKMGDDRLEDIVQLRIEGYSNQEIADKFGCVVRTIERKIRLIEDCWLKVTKG